MNSYSAFNEFPWRWAKCTDLIESVCDGVYKPIHIIVNPTNKCTRNCKFCICKENCDTQELSLGSIEKIADGFEKFGARAVDLSGGGEPLCHSDIENVTATFKSRDYKIGMITNGDLLSKKQYVLEDLDWCRISFSDERQVEELNIDIPDTCDVSFNYVITKDYDESNLLRLLEIAKKTKVSCVKAVIDWTLNDEEKPECHSETLMKMYPFLIFDRTFERKPWRKLCGVSLTRPSIDADGLIYPCCSLPLDYNQYPKEFSLGTIDDIEKIWSNQEMFYGGRCEMCRFHIVNNFLYNISQPIKHKDFL